MSGKYDRPPSTRVAVLGLGRFGRSLARELVASGTQVLGVDSDSRIVQRLAEDLTHTAVADTTDRDSLMQLGVHKFPHAVVAVGTDLESSILTTSLLADFQVPQIWAKATSKQHQRILERVGAHHVVIPEHDMGERVAHLVTGRMLDYIEFGDDYAMVKTLAPAEAIGIPLKDSELRRRYEITVVAVKRAGQNFTYATQDTVLMRGDILLVAGKVRQVEAFANIT
ncbi:MULTISPECIES: potassium channel family protein [Lolliginicoccus]|uniref:TrkA family potassium uptake protein n=1 Tax=Lolliginicoccus lacisalsi TaxID=2742202 RepID=A0A927JDW0_9ACTN|nr:MULTISPECIES: TrkA family potassium uptake protein [Lolliginicoccus]MBD8507226.1 TrkA family potassium uptake protein [Lolliginicoccus lacisalsi]